MGNSSEDPNLISAFETNKVEIELLGRKKKYVELLQNNFEVDRDYKKYFPCILVQIKFVALPEMSYQKEYQRGAIHLGRTEIFIQGYVATQAEIEAYKKKIESEDFELLASLESSMDALRDTLFKYLDEAKETSIPWSREDIIRIMEETGAKKDKAIEALKKRGNVDGAILFLKEKSK